MLSGLNESKGSNEEEEEYWRACTIIGRLDSGGHFFFSFSFSLYHFPLLCGNLAFYSNCLPHQKLAGNIREG